MTTIRLGTRTSPLALAQATSVAEALRRLGVAVTIVPMKTEGDRLFGARLAEVGGKGLFVREIEEALAAGMIDVAVHSLKDLPAEQPPALELAAFPPREDPRDVLVTRTGGGFEALPDGAVLGTSSLRRRALALALRPDLVVEPLRGNVDTRLRKLSEGVCDAVVLAAAGLARLGLAPAQARPLAPEVFVPAVGQGILGVEVRRDDRAIRRLIESLDHPATRICALAERAYLRRLGASCTTPMAAHAVLTRAGTAGRLTMSAVVASEDGRRILRADAAGAPDEAERLGRGLAESLLDRGAASVAALNPGRWPA
jgi:hydroxymethylbilane synthase